MKPLSIRPRNRHKGLTGIVAAALAAGVALPAVAATIKGKVSDADSAPLPGVAVELLQLPDSVRSGATMTDGAGEYTFSGIRPGRYSIIYAMTGMDRATRSVAVADSSQTLEIPPLEMTENAIMLAETVVTGVRTAVVAKEDTIEFNAGSFHTNPNANVEDLLKKLPGVEVGSDGSITSGGKTITKILVNGKEFFGDDPKMASKNLPSSMVEKVQVVDRKSELARLTGVDDGEDETVINLTVKKDMNNGWFGNVGGGYGTDKRYRGDLSISNFRDGNQFTIIGGANNINEAGYTDRGRGRFSGFGSSGGINTTQRLGINFNIGNGEKLRFGGNVFYSHSDRDARSLSETQYIFPDSVSYQHSGSRTRDKGHNISSDFRLQWNIDDNNTLDFRPRFSFNSRRTELNDSSRLLAGTDGSTLINTNENIRSSRGNSYEASGELIFNHKVASHPGRSFSLQANYSFSDTREKSTTWSDIEYLLRQEDTEKLYRYIDNKTWSNTLGARLTWTEPLGDPAKGNYLQAGYRINYRWNNADRYTYNLPLDDFTPELGMTHISSVPPGAELSTDLSNSFRNTFFNQELQIGYKKTSKTLNLDAGLMFSPSSSKSEDLIDDARDIPRRWVWNVSPYARMRYKFSKTSSLMVHYRARTSQPSMTQLQPVADISDPLNITVGNPSLKPTFTQNIGGHFNRFNADSKQSIFAVLNTSFALNTIVSRTTTDPTTGARTTTYTNADGNFNIFGMTMLTQPLRNQKWRFNVRFNGRYSTTPGYINGDYNRMGNLNLSPTAGLTFSSDVFQMTVNPTYSFGMVTNSLKMQKNRYTHTYGFSADASLYLPFGLELSSDVNFSNTAGYSSGFNAREWLWNAELSYSVLRNKSLTFSVRAYDILGQNKNVARSVSANTIVDSRYNDLTRYVMVGVTWKFNTLKKKKPEGDMPFGDMPPGPPPGDRGGHHGPPPGHGGGRPPF